MSHTDSNAELTLFKSTPIETFLPALGWSPGREKGKYLLGDRAIEVFKGSNGAWLFRDNGAAKKFGTVIDLALDHVGPGRFGEARRLLREILGNPSPTQLPPSSAQSVPPRPVSPHSADHAEEKISFDAARAAYEAGSVAWSAGDTVTFYLAVDRSITHIDPRHAGSFRVADGTHDMQTGKEQIRFPEPRGTIRFPYFVRLEDGTIRLGACEGRGPRKFQQYVLGGHNGFWMSCPPTITSGVAVVGESPLDVLAYDMMMPREGGHHLFALRAGSEKMCADVLRDMIDAGTIKMVVLVTDNDAAGLFYAAKIMAAMQVGRDKTAGERYYRGVTVTYHQPDGFAEDWNDVARVTPPPQTGDREPDDTVTDVPF